MRDWKKKSYIILSIIVGSLYIFATSTVAQEIKRQSIPVGMFNVYATIDNNNTGLPTPDLRDVWQGVPTNWEGGYYPYEACNLVQHYWPKELPTDVPPGQDAYVVWWTRFLREVYEQGNEKGEVRLRAIVGPLFSHYEAFGEQWLINFIQRLCEWERSGPHDGVIAGWYLIEEPMGSGSHNFNVDTFEEMAKVVDKAETAGGFRHHDRYVDVSLDGAFFTPQGLARFCRPADVVMVSSSSYLWLTSGTQPVFNTRYRDLAFSMNQVRRTVFPDHDQHGLPRPKIHLVLQAYDPMGFGQPTHWEMRQQIREALTLDFELLGNQPVAPADGIWFFWWPGLTFENKNRVDDWLYGRQIAEAIELEVAEVTGNGGETRSVNVPTASRFAFPPLVPFNPDDGIIPYELAKSGLVTIEILDMNGSKVQAFDMGIQSAGRLHRFGGPRWLPLSTQPDGRYIFRQFLNSVPVDSVEVEVQRQPRLFSPSHVPNIWSNDNTIEVTWRPPALGAGLGGFSFLWSNSPFSIPPRTVALTPSDVTYTSPPLPDGKSHYFHLLSVDANGEWGETSHLGPFWIDTIPPALPTDVVSSSHKTGIWSSANVIDIKWSAAPPPQSPPRAGGEEGPPPLPAGGTGGGASLRGYSIVWDRQPFTLPPAEINVGPAVTALSTPPLVDGIWYLHLRPADVAGNWTSDAVHLGPFQIDTHSPNPPSDLRGVSHQVGVWSNRAEIELEWTAASDETSGIKNYLIVWDTSPDTHPTPDANPSIFLPPLLAGGGAGNSPKVSYRGPALVDGDTHYVHLRAVDGAGLTTDETLHLGPFRIDATPPGDIRGFAAYGVEPPPTPPLSPLPASGEVPLDLNKWLISPQMILAWQVSTDSGSSVAVYEITRVRPETGEQQTFQINADAPSQWTPAGLSDGAWVFRLRAGDNAGNWSAYSDLTLKIDTTVPTPILNSPSHPNSERWYADANPIVEWMIERDLSGIAGYLGEWSDQPDTIPQTPINESTIDNRGSVNGGTEEVERAARPFGKIRNTQYAIRNTNDSPLTIHPSLPDGIWYFHLRAIDNAGNRSEVAHYKVQIEHQVPETPIIRSQTHPPERWSKSHIVDLRWDEAPTLSGPPRYSFALDHAPDTLPDDTPEPIREGEAPAEPHIEQTLDDGIWYFHLKAISRTGIRSETAHYRIQIDSQIATPVIRSPSHADSTSWYANPSPVIEWTIADDLSGIAGYFGEWDSQPNTIPQTPISPSPPLTPGPSPTGGRGEPLDNENRVFALQSGVWYFHLRAIDNAGNLSETAHYQVRIDASAPAVPVIQSSSHPAGVWRSQSAVDIRWNVGTPTPTLPRGQGGGLSGMAGYSFVLDQKPTTLPDERIDGLQPQVTTTLADGIWYFHLRAQSNTGLWSETAHYEIRIDTHPPEITITLPPSGEREREAPAEWFRQAINEYAGEMRDELSGIDETTLEYRYAGLDWKPFVNEASSGWLDTNELPHVTQASGVSLQVRVRDRAENVGLSEERLIRVDVEPPSLTVTSPTHPQQGRWYADPNPVVEWTVSSDLSGIADYFWVWDNQSDTIPRQGQKTGDPESQTANESKSQVRREPHPPTSHRFGGSLTLPLTDGIWYFHLIAFDNAGNPSEPVHYRFQIDTQPPKGTIHILRPEVIKGRPKSVRYLESKEVPPRVSSGEIRIVLTLSEEMIEPPKLFFQPNSRQEIALALGRSLVLPLDGAEGAQNRSPLQWHATLQVSPHTGDGVGKFRFVGTDGAGNLGGEITMGMELVIDTLIHADETEVQHRIGDNGAIATIPPRALRSDVRLHLEASPHTPPSRGGTQGSDPGFPPVDGGGTGGTTGGGTSNRYRLIAWDGTGRPLPNLTFVAPIELQLPIDATQPIGAGDAAYTVLYNDGVRTHRIGTVVAGGQAIASVSQIGEFLIAPAPTPKRKITGGWAAPNPFTPNHSGDASDRTIFHVQTRGDDVTFTIEIYGLTGRRIRTLRNGLNVWDGSDESGRVVENGVYIYQIHAGDEVISGTVVVVR